MDFALWTCFIFSAKVDASSFSALSSLPFDPTELGCD